MIIINVNFYFAKFWGLFVAEESEKHIDFVMHIEKNIWISDKFWFEKKKINNNI